jgi:hypothetical protein
MGVGVPPLTSLTPPRTASARSLSGILHGITGSIPLSRAKLYGRVGDSVPPATTTPAGGRVERLIIGLAVSER